MSDLPRIAVIDIGTNSVKLLIARANKTRRIRCDHFASATTRIGAGGQIESADHASATEINATIDALSTFKKRIDSFGCRHVFAFGTHALRSLKTEASTDAPNVVRRLERSIGIPIRVLSGNEEARYAYLSAKKNLPLRKRHTVLLDVGGGSTELVVADTGRLRHTRSLPIGALGLTTRFLSGDPIDMGEFLALTTYVDRVWRRAISSTGLTELPATSIDLAASGGTITTIAMVIAGRATFDRQRSGDDAPPPKIALGQTQSFLNRCLQLPLRERKQIVGLEPERADIICAGLAIVLSLMRKINKRVLYPNQGGVREGALIHLLQNGLRW